MQSQQKTPAGSAKKRTPKAISCCLEVMGMENAPCPQYRNTLDALRSIWQTEGFATLYKGVTMNFVKGTTPKPVVVS